MATTATAKNYCTECNGYSPDSKVHASGVCGVCRCRATQPDRFRYVGTSKPTRTAEPTRAAFGTAGYRG